MEEFLPQGIKTSDRDSFDPYLPLTPVMVFGALGEGMTGGEEEVECGARLQKSHHILKLTWRAVHYTRFA